MGGLFGIGGSAAKTDRKFQLQSWQDLQKLFGQQSEFGLGEEKKGAAGLDKSRKYFEALMSGDPTKMSEALAPQISAIKGQTGQAINTIGQFSGRSGGTAAAATEEGFAAQQAIQNLFDLLGPEAAKEVAAISGTQEAFGMEATGQAGQFASEIGNQTGRARETDVPVQQAQQAAVMEALAALAGL